MGGVILQRQRTKDLLCQYAVYFGKNIVIPSINAKDEFHLTYFDTVNTIAYHKQGPNKVNGR